jgi:thymidylate kinase
MSFLAFEGLDGSGKSSLMIALEKELQKRGISFYRTREPGGTPLGDEIRNMILHKVLRILRNITFVRLDDLRKSSISLR